MYFVIYDIFINMVKCTEIMFLFLSFPHSITKKYDNM